MSATKDMLNMLGRTLDTKIVEEMREARTGGEYAAQLACMAAPALTDSGCKVRQGEL